MLKHTSNAGAPATANGQLRNGSNNSSTTSQSTTTTSTVTTPRNIQLRPPQPLNISALSTATVQSSNSIANGGTRIPSGGTATAATTTTTTASNTPVTPLTPLTPSSNGILGNHNLHTYTNQHLLAAQLKNNYNNNNNNNNNANNQSNHYNQHNHHHHHHHLQQQQHHQLPLNTTQQQLQNTQPNYSNCNNLTGILLNTSKHGPGPREALTSLGLLCLGE